MSEYRDYSQFPNSVGARLAAVGIRTKRPSHKDWEGMELYTEQHEFLALADVHVAIKIMNSATGDVIQAFRDERDRMAKLREAERKEEAAIAKATGEA